MKTYRHKITGFTAVETTTEKNYKVTEPRHFTIPKWVVENSSDWELVEEPKKDWEILSFTNSLRNIFHLNNQGYYDCIEDKEPATFRTLKFMLEEATFCKINSIKRLSDGEVFSVGDYIDLLDEPISKIDVNFLSLKLPYLHCGNYGTALSIAEKRKALFTTEDGVELNEGDLCYLIHLPLNNKTELPKSSVFVKEFLPNPSYRLIFNNPKAAKEYIAYNKPRFSLNEIKNIEHEIGNFTSCHTLTDRLKRIIKSAI
jgi:hypothetical protein